MASVVGKLSPDIISTQFGPEIMDRANRALEKYAEDLLQYEELMNDYERLKAEAQVDADGNEIKKLNGLTNTLDQVLAKI